MSLKGCSKYNAGRDDSFLALAQYLWLTAFILLCPLHGFSDVIHLKNGKTLYVERSWEEGDKIRYEKNGSIFGLSKTLVARVDSGRYVPDPRESGAEQPKSSKLVPVEVLDETLDISDGTSDSGAGVVHDGKIDQSRLKVLEQEARLRPQDSQRKVQYLNGLKDAILWNARNNDFTSAHALMSSYLRLDPENLQANLILAWMHMRQGQYQQAENVLLRTKIKNDRSSDLDYLLGMNYYLQDKNELAGRTLKKSMELHYRPDLEQLLKKIEQENRTENDYKQSNSLHFVIRYEGSTLNHALSQGILASLERSFLNLESQLNFSPRESIAVVLYPDEVFQDVTRTPNWVGALNDGKIRFPIKGLSVVDERVNKILKHELTHSFLRLKTAGNCPLWLNEGLAQYLSGDSSQKFLPLAKQAISRNHFPELRSMEGSFLSLSAEQASWAYQESLLATEFLVKNYGLSDVQALLSRAGQTGSFETALKATFRKDYPQLQQEFEEYAKRQ